MRIAERCRAHAMGHSVAEVALLVWRRTKTLLLLHVAVAAELSRQLAIVDACLTRNGKSRLLRRPTTTVFSPL